MKNIIWAIVGLVVAVGAVMLIMTPRHATSPFDDAVAAAKRYGQTADEKQKAADEAIAAQTAPGTDTPACKLAFKALQQQRIATRTITTLPPRDAAATLSDAAVAAVKAKLVAQLYHSLDQRKAACGSDSDE
ncbi:MAG: hypothetical protein GC155_03535 [Alphaproteobacteria bacterium]|nr:hypothetical protein [Alphaproteobacteria bacterium]